MKRFYLQSHLFEDRKPSFPNKTGLNYPLHFPHCLRLMQVALSQTHTHEIHKYTNKKYIKIRMLACPERLDTKNCPPNFCTPSARSVLHKSKKYFQVPIATYSGRTKK